MAGGDCPVQVGPEVIIAGPLDDLRFLLGLEGVRGGVQALGEQPELAGAGQRFLARPAAADVEVLVPPHVGCERVLRLQSAPGTAVAQHDPHQVQRDIEQHLRPVVEAGLARREESFQPETIHRRLDTEVREGGTCGSRTTR